MADFREALDAALSAEYRWSEPRRPVTHRTGLKARMNQLLKAHGGSRREAAESAGIPYSSWGHMLSGKRHTSDVNRRRLEQAYQKQITQPKMLAALQRAGVPSEVTISAVVYANPGSDSSTPHINAGRHPDHPSGAGNGWRPFRAEVGKDALHAVVIAWFHYGADGAAGSLEAAIAVEYGGTPFAFLGNHVEVDW